MWDSGSERSGKSDKSVFVGSETELGASGASGGMEGGSIPPAVEDDPNATQSPSTLQVSSVVRVVGHSPRAPNTKTAKALYVKPRSKNVSLTAANMMGYLKAFKLAGQRNRDWIKNDVERWCSTVLAASGVVDMISGDRRYASFNGRRRCVRHACAAVEVMSSRGDPPPCSGWTGCIVSGPTVCGSFGCASTMRFMMIGAVAASLHPFERLAARWGTKVLTDGESYSSSCRQWRGVLLGA
eukprot:Hpha_TRINITY_DN14129_c0_g1::TRINITY_DN14129_c0_g1_i1::g.10638::m.10638